MGRFNSRDPQCKAPFGAVPAGTEVTLRWLCGGGERLTLAVRRDGEAAPCLVPMQPGQGGLEARFCYSAPGLYFYWFQRPDGSQLGRDADGEAVPCAPGAVLRCFQQTVYAADYVPAKGFAGRTFYQIFPDRFAVGSCGVLPSPYADRRLHDRPDEVPDYAPDEDGEIRNLDFFGGNLEGIREKLGYLAALGVDSLYLNPIGAAHSNHRYNTADYRRVDPMLGSEEDFRRLCREAHARDIRIVLDGVYSHTGDDSVYFNRYGTYPEPGAWQSRASRYARWYKFRHWPDDYVSWWGFRTLPEVNEDEPSFVEFICGEGGVIDYWLDLGADGFRLDVADELPDDFIERLRAAVRRHGDDKILIGEVWEDASNKISYGARRGYLWGGELDGVMNYPFRNAMIGFLRSADAAGFLRKVGDICENYPAPMLDTMLNLLSTHDTERALNALAVEQDWHQASRDDLAHWVLPREEYLRGAEMLKLCFALQFTLPGMPCVYYGDEIGMQGFNDPFCRGFMRWDAPDENIRAALRAAAAFRRANRDVLAHGAFVPLLAAGGVVAYLRRSAQGTVLAAVNRGEAPVEIGLPDGAVRTLAPWQSLLERIC